MPEWSREDPHWADLTWLTPAGAPDGARYSTDFLHVGHRGVADDTDLLVVAGPLDLSTTTEVHALITDRLAPERVLLFDLRAVTFLGSSGLTMLVDLAQQARTAGGRLVLVVDARTTLRPFDVLAEGHGFEVVASIEHALSGPGV